jgi:bacterial/archaeal transporter family-2 protein
MNHSLLLPIAIVALGGAAIAVQGPLNASLSRSIGSPISATAISFGIGFVVLAAMALISAGSGPVLRLAEVPLWQLAGGLLGAFYVWSVLSNVAALGVFTTMAALILGQVVMAMALDRIGAFGLAVQPISPQRLLAAAMVAGGLILSRL